MPHLLLNPLTNRLDLVNTASDDPTIPNQFTTNSGIAVPAANNLNVFGSIVLAGSIPFQSIGSGSTVTYQVQLSQAIGASNANNVGLAAFNSSQFSVDPNGFVSMIGGSAIDVINGDTGSITGATVTIYANNAANNSGSSVKFVNSGTISTLNLTDSNQNIYIGQGAGNLTNTQTANTVIGFQAGASITTTQGGNNLFGWKAGTAITTGNNNTCQGQSSLLKLTTGVQNVAIGNTTLANITTGGFNLALGNNAANSLTTSDSSNIIIGNIGVSGDNNITRIGTQGSGAQQQNKCLIAGIVGVTVANQELVTINSSTGQLGVSALYAYTATAISYQVLITDKIIGVTSNAAARTITMPNSGMIAGQSWTIKDEVGTAQSANNITISGNGANIDGAATFVINTNFGSATLYFNGTNFFIF